MSSQHILATRGLFGLIVDTGVYSLKSPVGIQRAHVMPPRHLGVSKGEILVRVTQEEIEMARELRALDLEWEPSVGHYVYDENRCCPKGSPFQDRLYFILNYDCFMSHIGGVERFKQVMLWLPTWHDARELLRSLGVSDEEVARRLQCCQGLENGKELLVMYEMIAESLRGQGAKDK
jgi:hypothetical protein